jgi:hypothetical protein
MCLSYQNLASLRDPQGCGSHAAHRRPAQLMLTWPSAVRFSTGRCTSPRRRRVSLTACISPHCQLGRDFERRRAGPSRIRSGEASPGGLADRRDQAAYLLAAPP